jgi:hypothetical protein
MLSLLLYYAPEIEEALSLNMEAMSSGKILQVLTQRKDAFHSAGFFSYLTHPTLSRLSHAGDFGGCQTKESSGEDRPSKGLGTLIFFPRAGADDASRDGRSGEDGEADNGEYHAHADAALAQVSIQAGQGSWKETLDATRGDAVEARPGVESRGGGDGHPAEDEEGGGDGGGDVGVDGAGAVGDVVGGEAADDADAVDDEEEVEGVCVGHGRVEGVAGEAGDVEEGEVDAPEALQNN